MGQLKSCRPAEVKPSQGSHFIPELHSKQASQGGLFHILDDIKSFLREQSSFSHQWHLCAFFVGGLVFAKIAPIRGAKSHIFH